MLVNGGIKGMTSLVSKDLYIGIGDICSRNYFKIPRYKKLFDNEMLPSAIRNKYEKERFEF